MKSIITASVIFSCLLLLGVAYASEKKIEEATIKLANNTVFKMKWKTFIPSQHKITTCKVLDWTGTCLIDGKPFFGTDWETPKSQLVAATALIGGLTKLELDVSNMFNPWTGDAREKDFRVTEVEGGLLIHGEFSDGAGSYEAEWLVVGGSSVRTKLQKSEH